MLTFNVTLNKLNKLATKKRGSGHGGTRVTTLTLPGKGIEFCHLFCTELEPHLGVPVGRSAVILLRVWTLV